MVASSWHRAARADDRLGLPLESSYHPGDRPMRFTKMHGIGNDYVYVSTFDQTPPADPRSSPWPSAIAISASAAMA